MYILKSDNFNGGNLLSCSLSFYDKLTFSTVFLLKGSESFNDGSYTLPLGAEPHCFVIKCSPSVTEARLGASSCQLFPVETSISDSI